MTKQLDSVSLRQSARWLPADTETPISLYMKAVGKGEGILLESAEVDGRWGRYSILALDMCFYITCRDGKLELSSVKDEFAPLKKHAGKPFLTGMKDLLDSINIIAPKAGSPLPRLTRALYGYLGYGMAALFNPHLQNVMPPEEADCQLALPATTLVFDHLYNRLCEISLGNPRNLDFGECLSGKAEIDPEKITSTPDEQGYKKFVTGIRQQLRGGEAIQVVPSVRFEAPFSGDPFTLYRRMRRYNASPYMFYMRFPDMTLFGSSPEVMARCSEGSLQLSPIAGTRKRGKDDARDAELARELLDDPKERAEHVMLVDLGRNDLGKIARPDSVRVERYMDVERFSHVMHLTSRITATLDDRHDSPLDVLAATFPAGTVSGAPKIRAMEIIRAMEGRPRGPYAGCIGWIGLDHDSVNLDMGITIRSMWVKDGRLYWQAGGGIVHDSDPDLEWKEVCNKSAIMRLALMPEDEDYVPAHR